MGAVDRFRLASDPWLSGILGRPAWTVVPGSGGAADLAELSRPGPHFATAKVPAADTAGIDALQVFGFRVVDLALSLDADRVCAPQSGTPMRFARPADRAGVEAIAGSAFRFSRFHLDPHLPKALADKVKAAWAANWFLGGRGDGMVVAEDAQGAVAGFLQLLWAAEDCLVIDLIAVLPSSARKGLASAMIGFAQARGTGDLRRPRRMRVGTQAANTGSVRLYEALGFRLCDANYVLHHHGSAA